MFTVFKVINNNVPNSSSKEPFKLYVPPAKRNLNNTANVVGLSKYFDCKFKVCIHNILYLYTILYSNTVLYLFTIHYILYYILYIYTIYYILVFKIIGILNI